MFIFHSRQAEVEEAERLGLSKDGGDSIFTQIKRFADFVGRKLGITKEQQEKAEREFEQMNVELAKRKSAVRKREKQMNLINKEIQYKLKEN